MTWLLAILLAAAEGPALTDGEVWNEGVDYYRSGDVTNALRVLKPLTASRTHSARAAELVAKLEYEKGDLEAAAEDAQTALRAAPDDPRVNRNFTRVVDRLPELREKARVEAILKRFQGQDPGSIMQRSVYEARELMKESAGYRTNRAEKVVATGDMLAKRAEAIADAWLPVKETIAQSVTNENDAQTIVLQLENAEKKTRIAAKELGDLGDGAYPALADVEHDYTRFLKLTAMPPAAIAEDLVAQSNAWLDVEAFNGRSWQKDALDYTRAFRRQFPAWAKAYEQQAQSDTNRPPFTAEDQAKISALATELEKIQLECDEKVLPPKQEEALGIINQIRELLPKDKNGGGQQNRQRQQQSQQNQDKQQNQDQQNQQNQEQDQQQQQNQDQQPQDDQEQDDQKDAEGQEEKSDQDKDIEAVLKKAEERSNEHEEEKRLRMRKAPLPPNERDW